MNKVEKNVEKVFQKVVDLTKHFVIVNPAINQKIVGKIGQVYLININLLRKNSLLDNITNHLI